MYQLFLDDAFDRVLVNPEASHCWLNLASVTRAIELAGHADRLILPFLPILQSSLPNQGKVGFYLALYLDFVTHEGSHLARASALLPTILPHDLDRMAAYFTFSWQIALARSAQRSEFLSRLNAYGIAAPGSLMGEMVAARDATRPPLRPIQAIQKVAVITPYLLSSRSTPSMMALEQAQLAQQNGMQVGLFSCQESLIPDFEKLLANGTAMGSDTYQLDGLIRERGLNLTVAVSDPRFSLMRRMCDMLAQISAFDPDLVLLVGFHSCLIQALYAVRPVLVLGVNSIAPMVPADVWLAARADARSDTWLPHVPASQVWHHPYRMHRKLPLAGLTRSELGLAQDALVLISSAWAAPIRMAASWLQSMATLLQQHPRVIWVLLGSDDSLAAALHKLPASQLRLLPPTENVMGVFACCDIYVNPPRMGGGFAVADAMAAGLPVVSFADSDGGDKIAAAASADEASYFTTLASWIDNAALRAQVGAHMRQVFDDSIDLVRAGPSLMQAYEVARVHYQRRIGQAEG